MPTLIFKSIYSQVIIPVCVGVTIYIGFSPLLQFAPEGISKEFVIAGLGAIFVSYLTTILLKRQSEIGNSEKRNEVLFTERLTVYKSALDALKEILAGGSITKLGLINLNFMLIQLQFIGGESPTKSFEMIIDKLAANFADDEDEQTKISVDLMAEGFLEIYKFTRECRKDMESLPPLKERNDFSRLKIIFANSVKSKKDARKITFKSKTYPKSGGVHAIIKDFVNSNPSLTFEELENLFPPHLNQLNGKTPVFVLRQDAVNQATKTGTSRHFIKPDQILILADVEIAVSNQWGGALSDKTNSNIDRFVEHCLNVLKINVEIG